MRFLLGQSVGRSRLRQCDAGQLAGSRSRGDRFGRLETHRCRLRRRRRAVDLDRRGTRRSQNRSLRCRPADAQRQDHARASLSQAGVRRRRRAWSLPNAGDQSRPRRAGRSAARGGSALHALLRSYADGDRHRRQVRRRGSSQCALRETRAKPQLGRRVGQIDSRRGERARSRPVERGHSGCGGRAGRYSAGGIDARRRARALGTVFRHRGGGRRSRC